MVSGRLKCGHYMHSLSQSRCIRPSSIKTRLYNAVTNVGSTKMTMFHFEESENIHEQSELQIQHK